MELMANPDSLAHLAPLVPLDLAETLLLSMMVRKLLIPALDPWE